MMSPMMSLHVLANGLFSLGIYGVLTRRHAIGMLLAVELILNAAALNLVLFSRMWGAVQGQAFALFVIALAACEAVVGLGIVIALSRSARTVFADEVRSLKG